MFNKLTTKVGKFILRSLDYIKRERKKNSTMWIYYDGTYYKFDIELISDENEQSEDEDEENWW